MGVFSSIMSKIFGKRTAQAAETPAADGAPTPQAQPDLATMAPGTTPAAPTAPVDVEEILAGMAEQNPQKLDWRHSIVDLMKLLGLDSSLEQRKELARELGYSGDTSDSAAMNIWLHRQVMTKLAENGGRVPDSLRG
ncbi:DUF3597 domain-containing protein [Falsiroseomonas sp. E2-1-a20]|uniref:DUF3597 domain-containing protein n=1 Tax=Falsiroseomonas sp. E2-1-a20 TaxID=3239300 RepID=UPI003F359029